MIDPPKIVQTTSQKTAVIHLTVPASEIRKVMGPGIQELMAEVAAQGSALAGPWFTFHFKRPSDTFDFEISVPVTKPIVAKGRVKPSELPARRGARTTYHGGYEGLGAGWGELLQWIEKSGHGATPELWECYVKGPESGADSSLWETQLNQPLT
jgi:effector-binding domain-containing protein